MPKLAGKCPVTDCYYDHFYPFSCIRESEEFEAIVSLRLEGLLKEAHSLLEARKAEKQALATKLKSVISILEDK